MASTFIQTEAMIFRFRKALAGANETARSIDRNDSWSKIAKYARREGFNEFADYLERSIFRLAMETSSSSRGFEYAHM